MDNKTTKELAKIALAALLLSAALPVTGYADGDDQTEETVVEEQNCAAGTPQTGRMRPRPQRKDRGASTPDLTSGEAPSDKNIASE